MAYNQTFNPSVDPTNPHQGAVAAAGGANVFDTNYLDEMRETLLGNIVLEGDTIDWAHLIPGVKNRTALNMLGDITKVKDASCGWNPEGELPLLQKELIVYPKEIKHAICPKELEKTYLGMYMKSNKEIPFVGIIAEDYVKKAKEFVEEFIWQGDGTNDGLYQILDPTNNSNVIDASGDIAVLSPFTWIGAVNAMLAKAPGKLLKRKDGILCLSFADFMALVQELNNTSNFVVTFNDGAPMEFFYPGTSVLVKATAGLDGLAAPTAGKNMILTFKDNVAVGTDMLDNDEVFDIWYSRDNDEVRVNVQFKIGAQTYRDNLVVVGYKN